MSNDNLRFSRRMSDINPHMSGPVLPMETARSGTIRGYLLAVAIGLALAWMYAQGWPA
jgi:hypothetical protein